METTFIYVLKDPETQQIRYVGKSNNPKNRLREHLMCKSKTHKKCWIDNLLDKKLKPILEIIEEIPKNEWQKYEKYYIKYYLEIGCDLVNWKDGGEGLTYGNQTSFRKGHGSRKIISIKKNGEIFKEFESGLDVQKHFDRIGSGGFYMVLKKKRRFYMGYNYLYLDEYIGMSDDDMKNHIEWLNNYTLTDEWRVDHGKKCGFQKGSQPWIGAVNNLRPSDGKVVYQYSLSGELIKEWKNAAEVERSLGISKSSISGCSLGKRLTAGGYKWSYKNN